MLIRHTFKEGDFALAVNMYVLLPFKKVKVFDKDNNEISYGSQFSSNCYAIWKPTDKDAMSVVESLAYATENHKKDLLELL
jgi:hypothetical protein